MDKTKTGAFFQNYGGFLALIVAMTAMLGSLYFSEIAGFIPCTLCWYQRILMYPLVLITIIGSLKQDEYLPVYVLPLSIIGIGISGYHVLLQNGVFSAPSSCSVGVPCGSTYVNYLGFITIPVMAFTAFTLITIIMALAYWAFSSDEPLTNADEHPTTTDYTAQKEKGFKWQIVPGIPIILLLFLFAIMSFRSNAATETAQLLTINSSGPQPNEEPLSSGEALFRQATHGDAPGCLACHSLAADVVLVGPSLAGIARRTAKLHPDQETAKYLRESIVNPDAYIVDGFSPNVMYQQYRDALTNEQIDELVDFMLTLH